MYSATNVIFSTTEDYKHYYIGNEVRHANSVGFPENSENMKMVICINDIIATIRIYATTVKLPIIQVYEPIIDHSDNEIIELYTI